MVYHDSFNGSFVINFDLVKLLLITQDDIFDDMWIVVIIIQSNVKFLFS
jgi:hypothetical protein